MSDPSLYAPFPDEPNSILLVGFLFHVLFILKRVMERWKEINQYLEKLVFKNYHTFLEGKEYVEENFFDDQQYTTSKSIMWTLSSIVEFLNTIEVSIQMCREFDASIIELLAGERASQQWGADNDKQIKEIYEKINSEIRDLHSIRTGFKDLRERVIALRDGVRNHQSFSIIPGMLTYM